ncbi:MAG: hypothetical protein MI723_10695, partial [Caulobacterales bacterium]|nr:hypothetical protein [Caulobacterales bacterium]
MSEARGEDGADAGAGGSITLSPEEQRAWMVDQTVRRLSLPIAGASLVLIVVGLVWISALLKPISRDAVNEELDQLDQLVEREVTVTLAREPELQTALATGVAEAMAEPASEARDAWRARIVESLAAEIGPELLADTLSDNAFAALQASRAPAGAAAGTEGRHARRLIYVDQVIGLSTDPSARLRQLAFAEEDEAIVQRVLPILEVPAGEPRTAAIVEDLLGRLIDPPAPLGAEDVRAYRQFVARLPSGGAGAAADWLEANAGAPHTGAVARGLAEGGRAGSIDRLLSWTGEPRAELAGLGWVGLGDLDMTATEAWPTAQRRARAEQLLGRIEEALAASEGLPGALAAVGGAADAPLSEALATALRADDLEDLRALCAADAGLLLCEDDVWEEILGDENGRRLLAAIVQVMQVAVGAPLADAAPAEMSRRSFHAARLARLLKAQGDDQEASDWASLLGPRLRELAAAGPDAAGADAQHVMIAAWGERLARDFSEAGAEGRARRGRLADEALADLAGAGDPAGPPLIAVATAADAEGVAALM